MRAWCPRCDAVRPGETVCPTCATPLATLEDSAEAGRQRDLAPHPEAPVPPPAPSRLRIALTAATLVVAGLAFVAGRSVARPAAPASRAAPATPARTAAPGADARDLGWIARDGKLTITAVAASRFLTSDRETIATVTFRIHGLPAGQRVLALRALRLLDTGGGVFSTVEHQQLGTEGGTPVFQNEGEPDLYTVATGPAPQLSSLARIKLAALVVVRPRDQTIQLDTSGPWPASPPLRAIDPGPRDTVRAGLGVVVRGIELQPRVSSAFVGRGQAVVVVDASAGFRGVPGDALPLSAELRAGGRVLCWRTQVLGRDDNQQGAQGIVLVCPAQPTPRLTVALGVGVQTVPLDATLQP
jgi:hypothetical protein